MKPFFSKIIFFSLFIGSTQLPAMHQNNLRQVLEYEIARTNLAITLLEPETNNPEQSFEARQTIRRMIRITRENNRLAQESLNSLRRIRERNNDTESNCAEPEDTPEIQQNMQLIANNQRELGNLGRQLHRPDTLKKAVEIGVIVGVPIICYSLYKWWNKKSDQNKKNKKEREQKKIKNKKQTKTT